MTKIAAHITALAALFVLGLGASAVRADTTLVYEGTDGRFTVDMRPGEIRIDDAGAEWQLYDADSDAIFAVNPADKSVTRLDRGIADTIRARVESLRAQIEERVQQLPESQRATARAALLQSMPGLDARPQQIGLDRTGRTDTVADVECEIVQVVRDGQAGESLCVASAAALGMSDESAATVKSMFELLHTMLAGTGFEAAGLPYLNLSGMPVRFVDSNSGEPRQLVSVKHDDLPDSRFAIPDDYIEQAPPSAGN